MASVKNLVVTQASAAINLGKEAAKHIKVQNVAIPTVSECGKMLTDGASVAAKGVVKVAREHPYAAAVVGGGLAIAAAPGIVAAPALAAVGFGAEGIVGASAASAVHGMLGNLGAGCVFSTLQSAGMGGYGVAIVNGVVTNIGGAVSAVGGIAGVSSWWRKK
ncbi:hypothetical protein PT974_05693 [Cladobotryum mycophilum]|uniref:Uncharacterized protein n=1 Tax=Cladobotryum mycophilum TaxID=491253 RepID=A0ABR0SJG9_9HYPO